VRAVPTRDAEIVRRDGGAGVGWHESPSTIWRFPETSWRRHGHVAISKTPSASPSSDVSCVGFAAPRALRPCRSPEHPLPPNSGRELGTRVTKNAARGRKTAPRFMTSPERGGKAKGQSSVSRRGSHGIPRGAAIFRRVARGILPARASPRLAARL